MEHFNIIKTNLVLTNANDNFLLKKKYLLKGNYNEK